jgi:hypothetical protein
MLQFRFELIGIFISKARVFNAFHCLAAYSFTRSESGTSHANITPTASNKRWPLNLIAVQSGVHFKMP